MSPATDQNPEPYQWEALSLTNEIRTAYGHPSVCINRELNQAARNHTIDMAVNSFLSTTGNDGASSLDRIRASGYVPTQWGINIMYGSDTINATDATQQLYNNATANSVIVTNRNFTHMGVYRAFGFCPDVEGSICTYWTLIFGTSTAGLPCLVRPSSSVGSMIQAVPSTISSPEKAWSPLVVVGVILGSTGMVLFAATLVVLDKYRRRSESRRSYRKVTSAKSHPS